VTLGYDTGEQHLDDEIVTQSMLCQYLMGPVQQFHQAACVCFDLL
jgi:hypothetical protein